MIAAARLNRTLRVINASRIARTGGIMLYHRWRLSAGAKIKASTQMVLKMITAPVIFVKIFEFKKFLSLTAAGKNNKIYQFIAKYHCPADKYCCYLSRWWDSNPQPQLYESCALPLSYIGSTAIIIQVDSTFVKCRHF